MLGCGMIKLFFKYVSSFFIDYIFLKIKLSIKFYLLNNLFCFIYIMIIIIIWSLNSRGCFCKRFVFDKFLIVDINYGGNV